MHTYMCKLSLDTAFIIIMSCMSVIYVSIRMSMDDTSSTDVHRLINRILAVQAFYLQHVPTHAHPHTALPLARASVWPSVSGQSAGFKRALQIPIPLSCTRMYM